MNLRILFKLYRFNQWVKQVFIIIPIVSLGSNLNSSNLKDLFWAVIVFSIFASSVYIMNDLFDKKSDELNPIKKKRPIASGLVTDKSAILLIFFNLLVVHIVFLLKLVLIEIVIICYFYFLINFFYSSLNLKNSKLIGIFFVASGFVLRFQTGILTLHLPTSYWGITLILLLTMLVLTGKRYQTIKRIKPGSNELDFWLLALILFTSFFAASYAGFISSPTVQDNWGQDYLLLTTIPISLGVFRYLEIVMHPENYLTHESSERIIQDRLMLSCGLMFLVLLEVGKLNIS